MNQDEAEARIYASTGRPPKRMGVKNCWTNNRECRHQTCRNCGVDIHHLLASDEYPWVHVDTGHPKCMAYKRAEPTESPS